MKSSNIFGVVLMGIDHVHRDLIGVQLGLAHFILGLESCVFEVDEVILI